MTTAHILDALLLLAFLLAATALLMLFGPTKDPTFERDTALAGLTEDAAA